MRARLIALAGLFVVGAVALSGQAQRQPASLDDVVNGRAQAAIVDRKPVGPSQQSQRRRSIR